MERSREQLEKHFNLETKLAREILDSPREKRTEVTKACYNRLYSEISDHNYFQISKTDERLRSQAARLYAHLVGTDKDVLDLGCGVGDRAAVISEAGNRCTGVEISAEILETARQKHPEVHFEVDDAIYLRNFEPDSFDVVLSSQMLEHLHPDDVPLHFESVARVLRPGGIYYLDTPNRLLGPSDVSKYFNCKVAQGFHLKEWTYRELLDLMSKYGFTGFRSPVWRQTSLLEKPQRSKRVMLPAAWKVPCEQLAAWVDRPAFSRLMNKPVRLDILLEAHLSK